MRENLSWGRSESGWKVELTSRAGGSARLEWGQFSDSSDSEEEEEEEEEVSASAGSRKLIEIDVKPKRPKRERKKPQGRNG